MSLGRKTTQDTTNFPQGMGQDPVRMPSLRSYWQAFKRQFWFAFICSIPIAILVIFLLGFWPKEYSSTAVVLFDPVLGKTELQEPSLTLANRVGATYTARFQDPEFLHQLAERVEEQGFPAPEYKPSSLKKSLGGILPEGLQPSSWNLSPEDYTKRERVETMTSLVKAEALPAQYQLSLTAKADKPEHAQILAREAINYFIVEELSKQREKLLAQSRQLSILESSMLREKAAPGDVAKTETIKIGETTGTRTERRQLKTQEQSLITAYLAKQAELTRSQGNQMERQFLLESELNNLLSRKGLEHPDVIQKRREIAKFADDPTVKKVESELLEMRQRLNELQLDMKKRGIAIDRSVQISGFPEDVRRLLLDTSQQIRNLELEADHLEEQINNPARRTRYIMVREPERPTSTSDKKKFLAAVGVGGALVVACFFLIMLVREMGNPYLTDSETLSQRYDLPVAAELPSAWTRRTPLLEADQVRDLRSRLRTLQHKKVPELMLLDSYRYLQQLLARPPHAQILLVLDLSEDKTPFSLALNLANVMATDSSERVLCLSFQNHGTAKASEHEAADLMSFLGGTAEWKDCRIKADDKMACDLALAHDAESHLDAFREDIVKELLTALRGKYQKILIDGFSANLLYENGLLWRLSDAVILHVGLNQTKKRELERLLQIEDESKVRAVVVKG